MCVMDREASWRGRAVKLIDRIKHLFPNPDEIETWQLCEELILSAVSTCEQITKFGIESENAMALDQSNGIIFT